MYKKCKYNSKTTFKLFQRVLDTNVVKFRITHRWAFQTNKFRSLYEIIFQEKMTSFNETRCEIGNKKIIKLCFILFLQTVRFLSICICKSWRSDSDI